MSTATTKRTGSSVANASDTQNGISGQADWPGTGSTDAAIAYQDGFLNLHRVLKNMLKNII